MLIRVECPCCGWLLMNQNEKIKTSVKLNNQTEQADYYIKCKNCKKEISILIIKK
jgi:hypothetical protein